MTAELLLIEQPLDYGQAVRHWMFGCGQVVSEWRNFRSCKICFRESPLGTKCSRALHEGRIITAEYNVDCPHCGGPTHVINGAGIYEILFEDGKIRSIHSMWLKKVAAIDLNRQNELLPAA